MLLTNLTNSDVNVKPKSDPKTIHFTLQTLYVDIK